MVVLGVDYGRRRVGLAVTDREEIICTPLATLQVKSAGDAVQQCARMVAEQGAGLVVVGMPINMDGSIGPKAKETEAFVTALRQAVPCEVNTWDERLSTVTAEDALLEAGLTRGKRRARVDKVAAQVILRSFLDEGGRAPRRE